MINQIAQIVCHNCGLIIIPKQGASDKVLLKIFERHLFALHSKSAIQIDTIKEVN